MNINTLKTTFGYLATMLRRAGLIKFESKSIERIYNYVPISKKLSTSGQPSKSELQKIKEAGFSAVINLAPHNAENSLANEAAIVTGLGLRYIHIPVDFKNPTANDFAKFVEAMSGLAGSDVWVHCAANMRVSAFVYRYRRDVLAESEAVALKDLHRVWEPFGVWKSFVDANRKDA
jgi:uncharacterized protein (TIGR01244 family)